MYVYSMQTDVTKKEINMTQDEALKWFNEKAVPYINEPHGPWADYCTVYENEHDKYYFTLAYDLYCCEATNWDCESCPSRYETDHDCCYEKYLYILEDGTINFDGEIYDETRFEQLMYNIV